MKPKIFKKLAKIENKNPEAKIHGIAGRIKIFVIGAIKEICPKLKIIIGKVKIWAVKVTEIISVKLRKLSLKTFSNKYLIEGFK